ncbi:transcriptional regulator, LytTR family [Fodinibius roseus]|uniref:Transcriptional regulator, LytTR family n=1 Tax=Fodinibius roseus TaxID=1194090 RepID=A0A1M5B8N4_9BACT|nr:LytTR family DNA-binding domain-containing protein [Fodinibius roseus]SHF38667.1 transcriptional regulator, LytTR family [Fodinibius roseus]
MTTIFRSPYPFFEDPRQGLWITAGVSLFVVLFLWVFKPFGIAGFSGQSQRVLIIGSGLVCFVVLGINHFLLPAIFRDTFTNEGWTVGKHIVWLWWQLISVGLGNYLFAIVTGFLETGLVSFLFIMLITFVIGFFPIAVIVLISHLVLYKRRLNVANRSNQRLKNRDANIKETLCFSSETGNEKVECEADHFLYAESRDNYAYICYLENGEKKGTMLRSTLKKLEDQISPSWILRCHRSYIVNLNSIKAIEGNAQGYKLVLNHVDVIIPVSRSRHKEVLKKLESI